MRGRINGFAKPYHFKVTTCHLFLAGDLINEGNGQWNRKLVHALFNARDCDTILRILLVSDSGPDMRVWHYTKKKKKKKRGAGGGGIHCEVSLSFGSKFHGKLASGTHLVHHMYLVVGGKLCGNERTAKS